METSRPEEIDRITALLDEIAVRMNQPEPMEPRIQELLGRLANTLPYLPRLKNAEINVAQAELAVRALVSPHPEEKFAETITNDLERRVRVYGSPYLSIRHGRTPASFVVLGVLAHAAFFAAVVGALWLGGVGLCRASGPASVCWGLMALAGAIGGATSLLARLNDFGALSRWSSEGDPLQLFCTGLLKPAVGIVAGLFAYATVSTGLVTIQVPGQGASPGVFYMALAFLAGFSERFAKDLTEAPAIVPTRE